MFHFRCLRIGNLVFEGDSRFISSTLQTLALPSQSIWSCLCLNNGNIAVACSDGSIRLFTQDERQMATKQEMEEFERELAQFAIPLKSNQTLSQLNRTELPGVEALGVPGKRDGQTLMINNGTEIEVHQWDSSEVRWVKIGVAVGSSEGAGGGASGAKTSYLGKDYDYVFDIELDDSGPKLKLPYNLSEGKISKSFLAVLSFRFRRLKNAIKYKLLNAILEERWESYLIIQFIIYIILIKYIFLIFFFLVLSLFYSIKLYLKH